MDAGLHRCPSRHASHRDLHDFLRQRLAVRLTHDPSPVKVACLLERLGQPKRERHVPQSAALGGGDVAFPLRTGHAQLPLRQIDVAPFQRDDLATPQAGVASLAR